MKEPVDLCGLRNGFLEQRLGFGQPPGFQQGLPELDLELDPRLVSFLKQRCRSLEEIARTVHVAAIERTPACSAELGGGPVGERPAGPAKLLPIAICLLEVVAEHLVQLDEIGSVLLEPVGETLVQLGSGGLRQRVVGCVSDQQVAEAERILAGKLRPVGTDELLAHQPRQARRHLSRRPGSAPAPLRGGRSGPRPSRTAARRARPVRAGRGGRRAAPGSSEERPPRRSPDSWRSATISSTKSGLPFGSLRMPVRRARCQLRGPRSAAPSPRVRDGSSSTVVAFTLPPPQPVRRSSSSGRAMQSNRIGASRDRSATCSTRSRKVCSPQCRSSKTQTSGRSTATTSRSLRNAQAISSRGGDRADRQPGHRSSRGRTGSSSAGRTAAATTSTTGQ